MLDFITRFFRREEASKSLAKERLRLVLMSDRVSLAPDVFDEMKGEMLSVIRRYLEIDEHALDMHFENLERQFALLASIPILKVRPIPARGITRRHGAQPAESHAGSNGAATADESTAPGVKSARNGSAAVAQPRRRRRRRRPSAAPQDGQTPADESPPQNEPGGPSETPPM